MTARQKLEIRKMYKHFFIFSSIPKVKYYWLGEPNTYHDLGMFYKNWGFYLEGVWLWWIIGSYSQEMMWLTLRLVFVF